MLRLLTALIAAGWLTACAPGPTINVTTTTDQPDATPGDGFCASPGGAIGCSLRAAVEEANGRAQGSSTRIRILNAGSYALGAGDGTGRGLVIGPGYRLVTIEGCCLDAASTTIEPAEGVIQRLLTIEGGAVTLRNLRLTGGRTPGGAADAPPEKDGGAIMLRGPGSRLSLERSLVEGNQAGRQGGGIFATDESQTLLLVSDSIIRANTASNAGVGGAGGIHSGAETGIVRSLIEGNTGNSGGLRLFRAGGGGGGNEILRSTFRDNITSNNGGGIRIDTPDGETRISFSTFSRNQSAGGSGGTAIQLSQGQLTLSSSTLSENSPFAAGSALLIGSGTTAILRSTIVAQNGPFGDEEEDVHCSGGGALVLDGFNLLDGLLDNCEVTDPNAASPDLTGPLDAGLGFYDSDPIGHYPLEPGSPALDAGLLICDGTDQLGTARPQDGDADGSARCDIGAIEQPAG